MFGKKADNDTYKLNDLIRDLDAVTSKARAARVNQHAIETALDTALRAHRSYIASMLRF
jgi:hypothetical protein